MHSPLKCIDDPMMRKLVALVQAQLPDSTHRDRNHLLAQLRLLEQEALERSVDPSTLRSIHATRSFVQRCDRLVGSP